MKKLAIKILSLIVAFTAVFAFANLNASPVKADDKANGFWMENGARVRFVGADEELTGIRFEANIAKSFYDSLETEENAGKILYVGIEIAPSMMAPVDICYSARKLGADEANYTNGAGDGIISAITFANEEPTTAYNFHASLTFRVADLISDLANNPSFNPYYVEGEIEANIASFENAGLVDAYLLQAISMDVVAKAYYRLDDGAKVYVSNENEQTRSMIYVANSANVAGEVGALTPEFVAKYLSTATEVENVYIQQDGEVVGYAPATLEGSTFYVHDGVTAHQVEVSLDNGKFVINDDLSKYYDLKDKTCLIMMSDDVIVTATGNIVNKKITNLYGEFVTLAIDETNDLKIFDSKLLNTGSDPVYGKYGWAYDIRYHYVYYPNVDEPGYSNVNSQEAWTSGITKNRYVLHQETEDVEHLGEYFYYAGYVSSGKTYVPAAISTALNTQDDVETTDVNEREVAINAITYTTQTNDYSLLAGKVRYARIDFAVSKWNVNDGYYVLTKDVDAAGLSFIQDGYMEGYAAGKYSEYGSEFTWNSADESANILDLPKGINHDQKNAYFGAYRAKYRVIQNVDAYYNYSNYLVGLTGHFDGKGHAIKNFVSNQAQKQWTQTYMNEANPMSGFFGMVSNDAIVENVSFIDVDTTGAGALGAIYSSGNAQIKNVFIKVKDGVVNPRGVLSETFLRSQAYKATIENVVIDATGVTFDTVNAANKGAASLFVYETGDGYRNTFNLVKLLISANQYAFTGANVNNVAIITNGDMPFAFYKESDVVYTAYASNKAQEGDLVDIIVDGNAYVTFSPDKESKGFTQYDSVEAFNNAETGVNKDAFNNEYWANINDKLYYESYFAENYFAVVNENDEAIDLSVPFVFESFNEQYTIKLKDTASNVIFAGDKVELEDASGFFKYENGVLSFNTDLAGDMDALGEHKLALRVAGTSLVKEFTVQCGSDPIVAYDAEGNVIENVSFTGESSTQQIIVKNYLGNPVQVTFTDNSNMFTYEDGVLGLKQGAMQMEKLGQNYEVIFKFFQGSKAYTTSVTITLDYAAVINDQVVYDTNPVLHGENTNRYFYNGQGYNAKEFYIQKEDSSLVKVGENVEGVFTNYVDRASFYMQHVVAGGNTNIYSGLGTAINFYSFKVGEEQYKIYYNNPTDKWLGLTMIAINEDGSVVKMNNALPVTDAISEVADLEIVNPTYNDNTRNHRINGNVRGTVTKGVFMLTNDIDATSFVYENSGNQGGYYDQFPNIFSGVFDGQGYEISNINLSGAEQGLDTASWAYYEGGSGLFGFIYKDSAILNLAMTNVLANNGSVFAGYTHSGWAYINSPEANVRNDSEYYPSKDILTNGNGFNGLSTNASYLGGVAYRYLNSPVYRNIYVEVNPDTWNFRGVFASYLAAAHGVNNHAAELSIRGTNVVIKYIPTAYGQGQENGEAWAYEYYKNGSGYWAKKNVSEAYRTNNFTYTVPVGMPTNGYQYSMYSAIGSLVGGMNVPTAKSNLGRLQTGGGKIYRSNVATKVEEPAKIGIPTGKDYYHESSIYVISPIALASTAQGGVHALTYEESNICGDVRGYDIVTGVNEDMTVATATTGYREWHNWTYSGSDTSNATSSTDAKPYYYYDSATGKYVQCTTGTTFTTYFNTYLASEGMNKYFCCDGLDNYTILSRLDSVNSFAEYITGLESWKNKFNNGYWSFAEVEIEGTTYTYPIFANKA